MTKPKPQSQAVTRQNPERLSELGRVLKVKSPTDWLIDRREEEGA